MEYTSQEERNARFQDLVNILLSVPKENFDPFDIYRSSYGKYSIGVDIIIPKAKPTRNLRPVIVRVHGGFLITGSSLFPAWFSKWVLDYAEAQSAVIISPNYRLLPEAKGVDILEDISTFWQWFHDDGPAKHLASVGRHDTTLDTDKLLLLGESAGGYLAFQSILSGWSRPKALVALYPMLDMTADHYTKEANKPIVGVPNFPRAFVDEFLESASTRPPITKADPPSRLDIALAAVHTGQFLEFLGTEPNLFVLERMIKGDFARNGVNETLFPPLFLLHGKDDSAVPVEGTRKFIQLLKVVDPKAEVRLAIQPGDHGFDATATLDDVWLREGLEFVTASWLREQDSASKTKL